MGKCVDDFRDTVTNMCQNVEKGIINKDGVDSMYLGLIAGYLADIADELHELNQINSEALIDSKQAQGELMTFNREMQIDLRRNKNESKT